MNFKPKNPKNGLQYFDRFTSTCISSMRSRDLIKFGMLYHSGGKWNDKQIISKSLVDESMRTHIYSEEPYGHGYQFWTIVDSVQGQQVKTT